MQQLGVYKGILNKKTKNNDFNHLFSKKTPKDTLFLWSQNKLSKLLNEKKQKNYIFTKNK